MSLVYRVGVQSGDKLIVDLEMTLLQRPKPPGDTLLLGPLPTSELLLPPLLPTNLV